ncbi:DUF4118 domain-containing protein [Edaphobacter sp. HDX4]|uniref:sensor histidine kinase n=1 Tax=Edaphobacter sp. HDX4 TaxID=2794064 RepID=UPI002FE5BDA0
MKQSASRWIVAAMISAATLATSAVAVRLHIGVAAAIPGFMLLALLASWKAGFLAAVVVSVASTVCLAYFFTEPKFSLTVYSYQDLLALASFVAVSVFVSHLVQRIRAYSLTLEAKERDQSELFQLSQNILLADWKSGPEEHLCLTVQKQLGLQGVAFWDSKASRYWFSGDAADAEEGLIASLRAGADCDLPTRAEHIRLLRFGAKPIGAVVFRGAHRAPLFMSAVAALIASNLERVRAMRAEVLAESVAVSEQLRTAVLDGLAHSVKTPLTTIAVSASGLIGIGNLSSLQQGFARTIEEQALSISEVTNKLLRTSRLDSQEIALRRRLVSLQDLFESSIAELPRQLNSGRITPTLLQGSVKILADLEVLRMALVQLMENALTYSPADSPVSVTAMCAENEIEITVHNEGTFIPAEERQLIFERYYRSPSTGHKAPGTGLGLSIAKRATDMHQGSVRVESSRELGTTFFLTVPKGGPC